MYYLAYFPMTVITPRLTALALYRKPSFIEVWSFNATPPPHSHDVYPHLIMATCLYKSALLVAELDSCLHP